MLTARRNLKLYKLNAKPYAYKTSDTLHSCDGMLNAKTNILQENYVFILLQRNNSLRIPIYSINTQRIVFLRIIYKKIKKLK
ncbi:MAG: hypothetical protein COA45_09160 [Zetaproteobacteria bacterium]|nr:MAG: hypothetical protein COA45_09160 [Zetaproteobacteria bacterium]